MYTPVSKICAHCDKAFVGSRGKKYCSDICKKAGMRTILACLRCKTEFVPSHLGRKYCGDSCARAARVGVPSPLKGKERPNLYRSPTRACVACGVEFRAVSDYKGRPPQQYCSVACRALPERPCACCNAMFKPASSVTIYCGNACRNLHYRERFKGEASHLWEGGRTSANKLLRTSAAYKAWRKAVFERDNYTCVLCGARCGNGVSVELHPDHIIPLSERPDLAHDVANGRTLCRPCHEQTDTWAWKQSKRMREKGAAVES